MKKCPFCAEEIQDEAIKCKHCAEWLQKDNQAPSQSVKEIEPSEPQDKDITPTQTVETQEDKMQCPQCNSYDIQRSILEDGSFSNWVWCQHCNRFTQKNQFSRSIGQNRFLRIIIYIGACICFLIIYGIVTIVIREISGIIINNKFIMYGGLAFAIYGTKRYLNLNFPIYVQPPLQILEECPKCNQKTVFRAYIENGGLGDWCPHCKESLQKMRGEI